jgi:hypothetical protein
MNDSIITVKHTNNPFGSASSQSADGVIIPARKRFRRRAISCAFTTIDSISVNDLITQNLCDL